MKVVILALALCIAAVVVYGDHTFMGTNVGRRLVHNTKVRYSSNLAQKRVEYWNYNLPVGQNIQGILAYDELNSGATANITAGGIGFNFVQLRLKSDRNKAIRYDVYLYL
ncbi:transcription activator MBF2 domain-containing protein [Phthorimaea operculella]|nr:transcription activator MBF2 domain-containing protein [Phthorimaea operculella]